MVRAIQGLSAGKLHRDNIYIEQKASLAYGKGAFHIVLPGVTASLEELPNGTYILQHIKTDGNYEAMQEASARPGLWRVDAGENAQPEFREDGQILNKEYRPVVISGMAKNDVHKTTITLRKKISKTDQIIKSTSQIQGFDMHYTPGDSDIVGLKKASSALSSAKDVDITRSAILLANTMYQARKIEGVLWYTDWDGSAVLTRAMEILHREKNISLKNHMIFLNKPTTKANYAIELAGKLDIIPAGKGKNTGWHPKELKGNILVSLGTDKETLMSATDVTGFGLGIAGAGYAAGFALTTTALTVSGAVTVAGAMFFVGKAIKSGATHLKNKKY